MFYTFIQECLMYCIIINFMQELTWPTNSGVSEDGARTLCQQAVISSDKGQQCRTIPGVHFDMDVEDCIEDILVFIILLLELYLWWHLFK
jgi:hypothetical protein